MLSRISSNVHSVKLLIEHLKPVEHKYFFDINNLCVTARKYMMNVYWS